jgi:DNA-binding PadR family transcriptional regulator
MSLPHALLTALVERPCSGYELASRFDRSIGFFWHATHQQIYRELGRLEEAGWAASEPEENSRGGRKRIYRILPAGRKELRRWIAQEQDPAPLRDEMMVRLRAAAAVGPSGLDAEMRRRLALHRKKLALFQDIAARDFGSPPADSAQALQHLVLQTGIRHEQLWIQVTEDALRILEG